MTNELPIDHEGGMSLVEVIVLVLVSGLFLSLVAVTFANGLSAQQSASQRNTATVQLNAMTAAIVESVRDSTTTKVSMSGQRLDAKVLVMEGEVAQWQCRAWQLDDGEMRYIAGDTAQPPLDSNWSTLASDVAGNLPGGAAFEAAGKRIALGVESLQQETRVAVSDGAVSLSVQSGGPQCWINDAP